MLQGPRPLAEIYTIAAVIRFASVILWFILAFSYLWLWWKVLQRFLWWNLYGSFRKPKPLPRRNPVVGTAVIAGKCKPSHSKRDEEK